MKSGQPQFLLELVASLLDVSGSFLNGGLDFLFLLS